MSLAKIASGDGYEYYLRSIATHDANERGNQALADYYSERGESPGRWWGSGLADLTIRDDDGVVVSSITAGEEVTEPQMWALFGRGLHPDAEALIADEVAAKRAEGISARTARAHALRVKARIGMPFSTPSVEEFSYRAECRRAYEDWNTAHGHLPAAPVPDADRERIATEVAARMFVAEHGHPARDEQELSAWVAKAARPKSKRIAGFDLTFSPVKSVSAAWALAPREVAAKIEAAHHAAIADALGFLEQHAVFTRIGSGGVAQVEVGGLIATMFDHRDSRAGDPDLHTHVVISNKVRRATGQWGALDGSMLYQHAVTASEIYNSRLEHHLETALGGVVFVDRGRLDAGKRPVRELAGMDPGLAAVWSTRAEAITGKLGQMSADFQARHGREPSPKELWRMSEEATLSTRGGKHHARSRAEQRRDWRAEAERVLGSGAAVEAMVARMLSPPPTAPVPERELVDPVRVAAAVVDVVAEARATWQAHHIRAEAVRQLRGHVAPAAWTDTLREVVAVALGDELSIPRRVVDHAPVAAGLTRSDGSSIYVRAGSTKYTSPAIVAAEARLLAAAQLDGGRVIPATAIAVAEVEYAANGHELNPGQRSLVHACATSGRRFMAAVAPAGTGKTTAMRVLVDAWTAQAGNVIALAPTAAAAAIIAEETGVPAAMTVDMLLALAEHAPDRLPPLGPDTLVILDEAAKTATLKLDAAVALLLDRGATVRAIGDDRQLSSVAAGGIIRDIVETTPSPTLTRVMRFADPGEAAASLAVREGDPAGLAYFFDQQRVHVGTLTENVGAAFRAWRVDRVEGRDAAMLAPTRAIVGELNALARADRLARAGRHGQPPGPEVALADGLFASAGDVITTRRNNRRLPISGTDYVRNGYRWTVQQIHRDGRITATHLGSGRRVILPADYVREHVGLGYATTIDSAQGLTVDRCHGVLTGRESRAQLYVMLTRGRTGNHLYLATTTSGDEHSIHTYDAIHPPTALDLLTGVLAREGTQTSATTDTRTATDPHQLLAGEVDAYHHALGHLAETHLGAQRLAQISAHAEQLVPGITDANAWPVLRQHLAVLDLSGTDALTRLTQAAAGRELGTAADPAAVLDWRIDPTGRHSHPGAGPLPWLPAIPAALRSHDQDHQHLTVRAARITELATTITENTRTSTDDDVPLWARALREVDPALVAELAVWRAAHRVPDLDRRPTGPTRYPVAERREQQRLDQAVAERIGADTTHTRRWRPIVDDLDPRIATDPYWPALATELTRAADTGIDIPTAVRAAHGDRQLPAEQPAAALRWRLTATLDPLGKPQPTPELAGALDIATEPALPPVGAEWEAAMVRAREQLRDTNVRDPRRMSDAELAELARALTPRPGNEHIRIPAVLRVHDAEAALTAARERDRQLDQTAAAIRRAQPAVATAETLQVDHDRRTAEIRATERELAQTSRIKWRVRTALQTRLDELEREQEQAVIQLAAARAEAARLTAEVPTPSWRWERALTDAGDHTARDTRLSAAADELATARAELDRVTALDEPPQLRLVRAEIQRRDNLTGIERDAENHARTEVDTADGSTAQRRRTEHLRRATAEHQHRGVTTGTGLVGHQQGPSPATGPSRDDDYGL
ncbi:MobF family relaxase [Nocardia higoensis]|nr:MobF family relaxase [Nocardia higoensis]